MRFDFKSHSSKSAYTLIELLIVTIIIAILATMSFPLFGYLKGRANQAACISHLRIMHGGFMGYMGDHDEIWPQMPPGMEEVAEEAEWKWWYEQLKGYGVSKAHWLCPADVSSRDKTFDVNDDFASSYIPTPFDGLPNTAFKWSSQPWVIERGSLHGDKQGPNILMPDGTIRQGLSLFPD
jgi:prepilin-type N-terminal cleavage/methylation domain-containing protein